MSTIYSPTVFKVPAGIPEWKSDINAIQVILDTLDQTEDLDTRSRLLVDAGKLLRHAYDLAFHKEPYPGFNH